MKISDMDQMEEIISSRKNLSWDGWDVVYLAQDDYGEYLPDGFFDRETKKWYRKSVYKYEADGWNIPDSVLQ